MTRAAGAAPAEAASQFGGSVAEARMALTRAFADAGIDAPALEARVLLQHLLATTHAGLAANPERRLDAREKEQLAALALRRLAREPLAYIVGEKEFWGMPLRVTRDVLVPRPDTEILVEAALEAISHGPMRGRPARIVDIGTGSGAILLALLRELPLARGVGIDISPQAAAIARANVARCGLADRTLVAVGDLTAPLARGVDLLVSNPPYVETNTIDALDPEVSRYEPRLALDGGRDGLAFYRRLAADAVRLLAPGGHVAVEFGAGQLQAVTDLFAAHGLAPAAPPRADLVGIPRARVFNLG